MWFTKKHLLLILTFIVYICLSILIQPDLLYNYDYLIPWYAALYITKGIPLYEQPEFKFIDGERIAFPYHLPLYIYFLATLIWAFGESFIAGKISLVIFIFCDAFLLEYLIKNQLSEESLQWKIWNYTSVIFLLNPIILITTITGLFDSLALLYFLCSFFFLTMIKNDSKKKDFIFSFLAGLYLSFGFLTKIIPILLAPVIFLVLAFRKQILETIIFTLTFLGFSGGMVAFLFKIYPNIKYYGFGWQMERGAHSFSIYYYLVDLEFMYDLVLVGVGMFILCAFFCYESFRKKELDLFIYSGIFIIVFFILYRIFYPHYIIWFIPYLSYLGMKYIEKKQKRETILLLSLLIIQIIAIVLWYIDFFGILELTRAILLTASFFNLFSMFGYLVLLIKERVYVKKKEESAS